MPPKNNAANQKSNSTPPAPVGTDTSSKGPAKSGKNQKNNKKGSNAMSQSNMRIIRNESLLATETEKHATSKSLYGDRCARISSNISQIHDQARMRAYESIVRVAGGKRVLHISCGMGLIAMLAARNGAHTVVAVDSSAVVDAARVVAEQNNLTNIHFFRGALLDVAASFPVKEFDIIICEWMGVFLTSELDLLRDVVYCRDHLLAEGGYICPNVSSIHVVGTSDYSFYQETVDYWSNVYGFNMDPMKDLVRNEVETCTVPPSSIGTTVNMVQSVDISKLDIQIDKEGTFDKKKASISAGYTAPFCITATHDTTIHYLTFYVDAKFLNPTNPGANFIIGFRPGSNHNAWTEVSVGLREWLPVKSSEKITGTITVTVGEKGSSISVEAQTEGFVAPIKTTGQWMYLTY